MPPSVHRLSADDVLLLGELLLPKMEQAAARGTASAVQQMEDRIVAKFTHDLESQTEKIEGDLTSQTTELQQELRSQATVTGGHETRISSMESKIDKAIYIYGLIAAAISALSTFAWQYGKDWFLKRIGWKK